MTDPGRHDSSQRDSETTAAGSAAETRAGESPAVDYPAGESPASAFNDELADSFGLEDVEHRVRRPGQGSAPPPDGAPSGGRHAAPIREPTAGADPSAAVPWPRRRQDPEPEAQTAPAEPNAMATSDRPPGEADRRTVRRRRRLRRYRSPWWELPALVLLAIAIAVLVKSFVVQPFYIPSQSMEKTLHGCPGCAGDRILVNKLVYDFGQPHPGDIVVFHAPQNWDEVPAMQPPSNPVLRVVRDFGQLVGFVPPDGMVLVKRVIATGGQTVRGVDGTVQISDHGAGGPWRTLKEPYVFRDGRDPRPTFGPVTVPAGRLWVMGDHRNDSADSRYHCDAAGSGNATGADCDPFTSTVAVKDVIGKAFVIAWPPSRWRTLGTPTTFTHQALATGAVPVGAALAVLTPLLVLRRRRGR